MTIYYGSKLANNSGPIFGGETFKCELHRYVGKNGEKMVSAAAGQRRQRRGDGAREVGGADGGEWRHHGDGWRHQRHKSRWNHGRGSVTGAAVQVEVIAAAAGR